ncbi:translation initiation factor IF-2-like [Zalophus californianus]|uniref:Translation initiation factor IF-2-like n=1 Tax=Zalophus californianus TaxID=9704 RepID=A0A6P9FGU4_ZALCA|nr:translation initiation factor IF-2-like [Zalophus californianus]
MTYTLLYLESYLALSEETQSPNAGSEDRKGQNPNPSSRCTEARASPKGRARGRPRGPALRCLLLAPSPARALGRSAEVAWKGTRTAGPSQGVPGPGPHSPPASPTIATLAPGNPSAYTPGGRKFFPPFSPWSSAGARAPACSLASPDAGGSYRRRRGRRGSRAQRSGFSGPAPKPGPAPRSRQDPGSPAPHPWRPSLALTSGCAAPAPARRPESRGSRVGAGGLMDRGRRRRVAVAGAAPVLAGRNGSRSTSSRSCSPPSPPFPSPPPPPPPPPGSPGRMPGRGKSVLLPVSLCGYARRGSHRGGGGGGGSGSIAPALSPQPRRAAGLGLLRARAPGGGCAQARQPPGLRAGAAEPGPGLELQLDPRRRGRRRRRGGWRGRGAGTMLPSGSLRSGYRLL